MQNIFLFFLFSLSIATFCCFGVVTRIPLFYIYITVQSCDIKTLCKKKKKSHLHNVHTFAFAFALVSSSLEIYCVYLQENGKASVNLLKMRLVYISTICHLSLSINTTICRVISGVFVV